MVTGFSLASRQVSKTASMGLRLVRESALILRELKKMIGNRKLLLA